MKGLMRQVVAGVFVSSLIAVPTLVAQNAVVMPSLGQMPDLVAGLRSTPGCLGVELATTASGKQVIFAWFENKKAVANWYYSDVHLKAMAMMGTAPVNGPLSEVVEDGPVLAIASVTLAKAPADENAPLAVSQVAIELYRPLPGGAAMGGRFAPSALKVPGLREAPANPVGPAK